MVQIQKLSKSIKVRGNIRSISDVSELKSVIDAYNLRSRDNFTIEILDSFAMPSAMIGYLLKLVQQEEVILSIKINDQRLAALLEDLNLKEVFNIHSLALTQA